jgi:hypothetical protein
VLQFDAELGRRLDKKDLFMDMCTELGLQVPLSTLVRSVDEVLAFDFEDRGKGKQFLMKCVGVDDRTRNNMTLFPMPDLVAMRERLEELRISEENPYILQEFVQGPEYLTYGPLLLTFFITLTIPAVNPWWPTARSSPTAVASPRTCW